MHKRKSVGGFGYKRWKNNNSYAQNSSYRNVYAQRPSFGQNRHENYEDGPDNFNDTFTGRVINWMASARKSKKTVTCNNFTFESCTKEGTYRNLKTGELLDV